MPFAAAAWWLRGVARARGLAAAGPPAPPAPPARRPLRPRRHADRRRPLQRRSGPCVEPMPGARAALRAPARRRRARSGVVSNQCGVARGLLSRRRRRRRQRPRRRRCSARSARSSSARTGRTTAARAASRRRGSCCGPPRALGVRPARLRGGRRHRRRRRGRARPPARAACSCPTPRTRREEVAQPRPSARRTSLPPSTLLAGGGGMTHVLAIRLDNDGDVLLAGPAIRALAAGADRVTLLCGPRGRQAAALLPGVDEVARAGARRGSTQSRAPVDRPTSPRWPARSRALRVDRALVLRLLPPEPAADGARAAAGRRALDRRDLGRLPGLAARPAPPDRRRRARGGARARPRRGRPASRCRPATTAACACTARRRRSSGARRTSSCIRARRCPRAPGRPSAAPSSSRRSPPAARGPGHRRAVRAGADRARRRRARARPRRAHVVRRPRPRARRRGRRRRRQHRPRAPRRGGRHAGRLAVRAHGPGRALAALGGARTSCCTSTCRAPAAARARAPSPATRAWPAWVGERRARGSHRRSTRLALRRAGADRARRRR